MEGLKTLDELMAEEGTDWRLAMEAKIRRGETADLEVIVLVE